MVLACYVQRQRDGTYGAWWHGGSVTGIVLERQGIGVIAWGHGVSVVVLERQGIGVSVIRSYGAWCQRGGESRL